MIYDIIIVGGGIVGLATAYNLQKEKPSLKILVLEKESELASHQTANNSGVIHSGLYYKPGSLKARNCIDGYHKLIDFCQKEEIPYELCGKIVVATTEEQIPLMENLYARGLENGLEGLKKIGPEQIKEYEPHVAGLKGIFVPQTGIVDYLVVAKKYAEKIQQNGGIVKLGEKVVGVSNQGQKAFVQTNRGEYHAKVLVDCAGLYSDKIAKMTQPDLDVKIVPFRGEYYKLKKEKEYLVKNLIYPVPDPNFPFLGVHFTRMMRGGVEAGPNAVLAFGRESYRKSQINMKEMMETLAWPGFQKVASKYWKVGAGEMYRSFSKAAFTKALQGLIPEIQESDLVEGGAGIRAQACDKSGGLVDDFLIYENEIAVNVCNAPSPAATSSLSIGETVAQKVLRRF
ncbi:L-2-hydroxyglutarate oxidase [Aureibacter tunicatorum]|uniref:L-2-hydroxyglutarate oxidase n=1 Tax=Aureibacter tunicatorum TaxID=866807 RepID=A0AAE3XUC8_9BACT|nr:L-2-hydroxyglutarate oxidase [Aureibacter tunicatorum]MDR6242056.1 L-2-hydroxyglutarate oxidase [Aureibacter tunicatorum]BDD03631.1 hydroxyglutarate oxidase [Aureibacter tunicatorum]